MTDSSKPIAVIPGDDPVQLTGSPQLERLAKHRQVAIHRDRPASNEEKIRRAADGDVMINSRGTVKWPAEVLSKLPRLRFISTCGIGTDAIDLETARQQGIVVSNIPGKTAPVVAEHAFGLMLAASKRAAFQTAELKAGRWTHLDNVYLTGKTLGVIGAGSIGAEMARLGRALSMRVLAWTFHPSPDRADSLGVEFVELDELLRESDAVSLHLKLTPNSKHLIGRRELGLMKPGSLLVNTARGKVIDTNALVEALHSGHLAGAGLDVFDDEPLPADHPLVACEQVVLTPHNADQTPEGCELLNTGAVDNVIAFLEGRPQNVVT